MKKFLTFMLTIFISAAMLTGCSPLRKDNPAPETTTIRLENSELTLEVPFPLKDGNMEGHLGDAAPYIKEALMKSSETDELVVLIFGVNYDKNKIEQEYGVIFEPDLEGGLLGGVGRLKNVQHTDAVKDVVIGKLHGKEINGAVKLKFKGDSSLSYAEFRMMTFAKGSEMWMVGVIRKPGESTATVSNEIFKSIKLQ